MARRSPKLDNITWKGSGMSNTGWTRVEVSYLDEAQPEETSTVVGVARNEAKADHNPSSTEPAPPSMDKTGGGHLPYLTVKVITTNVTDHLAKVKRQGGGIGSAAYDQKQKLLKEFFGGGGGEESKAEQKTEA